MKVGTTAQCYMLITVLMCNFAKYIFHSIPSIWRKPDGTKFDHNINHYYKIIIFWTRNFRKIRVFDYNQDSVLITYTQVLDFSQLGQFQILGPNLPRIIWMAKVLKI